MTSMRSPAATGRITLFDSVVARRTEICSGMMEPSGLYTVEHIGSLSAKPTTDH
jgi:hypothetical protein